MTLSLRLDLDLAEQLSDFQFEHVADWLKPMLNKNLQSISALPALSRKNEHWKYNDSSFCRDRSWLVNPPVNSTIHSNQNIDAIVTDEQLFQIDFINGQLAQNLDPEQMPTGLRLVRYNEMSESQRNSIKAAIEQDSVSANKLTALVPFLAENAIQIEIEQDFEGTLLINHLTQPSTEEDSLSAGLLSISVGLQANATIVENYVENPQFDQSTQQNSTAFTSLRRNIVNLSDGASLSYFSLCLHSLSYRLIDGVEFNLARDAILDAFYFSPGGILSKHDITVRHQHPGSEAKLNGIYLPRKQQCIDFHTNIQHRAPHCNSNETFRGIVDDKASATFNGKIHIFPKAQKSDAFLSNKNLLLTNQAEVNTKPELEIYADDVRCAHGATVAQLDDKATYFLQTRGIKKSDAQKMLSVAFVKSLVKEIQYQPVRRLLEKVVEQRLS